MNTGAFVRARELFPGATQRVFMNVAQRGLIPLPVRAALDRYLDGRTGVEWSKEDSFDVVAATRERFARFIGAQPDEIAFTKNVSDGINMVAGALDWRPGDNIVMCPDLEHPANVFPWYNQVRLNGVEIRALEPDDGRVPVQAMVAAADDRTRVVTAPTVSFSPGFVTEVGALSEACRPRGIRVVVDAAQSVGVLHTDVEAMGVDALAVATQKGMLACYGQGFLYCRAEFADTLRPAALARFGVAFEDDAHETALTGESFAYAPGARRFDVGNYNYLGVTAAHAALELLEELGSREIETYVRGLAARLAEGFLELGLPVPGGAPGPHLGNIVAVGTSGGGRHYTADDPALNELHDHLVRGGVDFSIRRGVLRFSLHLYNDQSDVDRVLARAREWVER